MPDAGLSGRGPCPIFWIEAHAIGTYSHCSDTSMPMGMAPSLRSSWRAGCQESRLSQRLFDSGSASITFGHETTIHHQPRQDQQPVLRHRTYLLHSYNLRIQTQVGNDSPYLRLHPPTGPAPDTDDLDPHSDSLVRPAARCRATWLISLSPQLRTLRLASGGLRDAGGPAQPLAEDKCNVYQPDQDRHL